MIVLNTVSTVNGQNQTDIKGWRMAEWDMSRGDLIEAFKGEISQIESNTLVIEKFTISEYSFDVEFLMNEKTSLLEGVVFRYNLKSENYKWLEYKSAFNFLEKSLIEKYGVPTNRKNDVDIDKEWDVLLEEKLYLIWIFPNTIIEIEYHYFNIFAAFNLSLGGVEKATDGMGWLSLEYRKPNSKVLDKF